MDGDDNEYINEMMELGDYKDYKVGKLGVND